MRSTRPSCPWRTPMLGRSPTYMTSCARRPGPRSSPNPSSAFTTASSQCRAHDSTASALRGHTRRRSRRSKTSSASTGSSRRSHSTRRARRPRSRRRTTPRSRRSQAGAQPSAMDSRCSRTRSRRRPTTSRGSSRSPRRRIARSARSFPRRSVRVRPRPASCTRRRTCPARWCVRFNRSRPRGFSSARSSRVRAGQRRGTTCSTSTSRAIRPRGRPKKRSRSCARAASGSSHSAPTRRRRKFSSPTDHAKASREQSDPSPCFECEMEIGVDSFAAAIGETSIAVSPADRLRDLLDEIEHADQVGLEVFGIGEHHRKEFLDSAPAVILAAAAARTMRIRLTSAVAVVSAVAPARLFQEFATLDLISRGRAEMVVGRGSFIEAFPLFGLELDDYDSLFAEKLDLLLKIRDNEHVHWSGQHRPALTGQGVYPRPLQDPLPIWVGVGGTPESFVRAGALGLPLMVAIIGGETRRFRPFVDLYGETGKRFGHSPDRLKVGVYALGYIARTTQEPLMTSFPATPAPSPRSL